MNIAVSMGDPAGVGPELCLDLLAAHPPSAEHHPIVFGSWDVLKRCAQATNKPPPTQRLTPEQLPRARGPAVLDLGPPEPDTWQPGNPQAACGAAAHRWFCAAIDTAIAGSVDAVVTAPISKAAWNAAGIQAPGHTEVLVERTASERHCMMLTAPEITCSLVSVHIGLHQVPAALSADRIFEVIDLTHAAMQRLRTHPPRLAVLGLNPHAGEDGLFGHREEQTHIQPAIARARARGYHITGPLPPDTAFLPAHRASLDAYICMYHDQGLIPLKTLAFEQAVNVTLGTPIVRTSVDHGTAFDIAWQGRANPSSMQQAFDLALRLAS